MGKGKKRRLITRLLKGISASGLVIAGGVAKRSQMLAIIEDRANRIT